LFLCHETEHGENSQTGINTCGTVDTRYQYAVSVQEENTVIGKVKKGDIKCASVVYTSVDHAMVHLLKADDHQAASIARRCAAEKNSLLVVLFHKNDKKEKQKN
jgi:hypothetical protein